MRGSRATGVQSLGGEDTLEEEMAIHSSILAWRIPWTEDPGGLQSMGSQRVRHALVTGHAVDVRLSNPDNGGSQYPKIKPFVSICISVFMSNHLYISISHIYTYIYIFISFLYIYLPHVHTYIYTHTHMYIYTHTYICKYMSCCAKSPEWITHCSIQGSPKK